MAVDLKTKQAVVRMLAKGASYRAAARECGVSQETVLRVAEDHGYDADPGRVRRRRRVRCERCGSLNDPRRSGCPICVHAFKAELARRRREFERRLKDDLYAVLAQVGEEFWRIHGY